MKPEKLYARINVLIDRLDCGEDVSRSSLARVLKPEQMGDLDESWKAEKISRKKPKPSEICRYESLLGQGVMLYGRYESKPYEMSNHESSRLAQEAEKALEKALNFAVELVQIESSFRMWFDRDPKDAHCGAPATMPRVVTSKSHDNLSNCKGVPFTNSKRDLKLAALYEALEKLQPVGLEAFAEPKSVLRDSRSWRVKPDLSGWKF